MEPARFEALSRKIQNQVGRADDIIRRLNRFSHSVDESSMKIDLADTIEFMIAICGRLAAGRKKKLDLIRPEQPEQVVTNLFVLENILWRCFDFAMVAAGSNQTVTITVRGDSEEQVLVCFSGLTDLVRQGEATLPGEEETALLDILNGTVVLKNDSGEMFLTLPRRVSKA
ncbi:MAG: hypothetical protein ACOZF0_08425 [Thermodesulfobacteriota bacterium]